MRLFVEGGEKRGKKVVKRVSRYDELARVRRKVIGKKGENGKTKGQREGIW